MQDLHNINSSHKEVREMLKNVTNIRSFDNSIHDVFYIVFREHFLSNIPHESYGKNDLIATNSNWTHACSIAMFQSAKLMQLNCTFEASGRIDAIISEKQDALIFAEWENSYETIFGEKRELDKLWKSASQKENSAAILLTYVPEDKFGTFLEKVILFWQKQGANYHPILYLSTVLTSKEGKANVAYRIRTVVIRKSECVFWEDLEIT